jgi:transcriptional regulator with XRE-family HTH domain
MATRIRDIRKTRGLTLQQLADAVGTTAQTIQRLETANMTVSLDWLLRIAAALDLTAADLLDGNNGRRIQFLGMLGVDDSVMSSSPDGCCDRITIELPQGAPVAVKLSERMGDFEPGTILVAERIEKDDWRKSDGLDCLVSDSQGRVALRRIVYDTKGKVTLVQMSNDGAVERNPQISWIAPLKAAVRYL